MVQGIDKTKGKAQILHLIAGKPYNTGHQKLWLNISTRYVYTKFQRNLRWLSIFHVDLTWNDP